MIGIIGITLGILIILGISKYILFDYSYLPQNTGNSDTVVNSSKSTMIFYKQP